MPIHVWTIFCKKASVDQDSNNISLFEVIEQFNIGPGNELAHTGEGVIGGSFDLVSFWMRSNFDEPETAIIRFGIVTATEEYIEGGQVNMNLEAATKARAKITLTGVPIRGIGLQYFKVDIMNEDTNEWEDATRLPLMINLQEPAE